MQESTSTDKFADEVFKRLAKNYQTRPKTGLNEWKEDWQLLFSVILSAQSNDDQVNKVTKKLFTTYPSLHDFVRISQADLENAIRQIGFFRNKAKFLRKTAALLAEKFEGTVPYQMNQLLEFPGVGRKTAAVVQGVLFEKSEGIAVDTHVARTSNRLGLTQYTSSRPEKVENDLKKIIPKGKYHTVNHYLFWHGREICTARKPKCDICILCDICPSAFKQ